jgi:hypothetical protein
VIAQQWAIEEEEGVYDIQIFRSSLPHGYNLICTSS